MLPAVVLQGRWRKVTIEQLVATQGVYNDPSTSWTTFADAVPMRMGFLPGGTETYGNQQIEALTIGFALMNYMRGITDAMRLRFVNDGVTVLLDIVNVENVDMANRRLLLKCKTGVNRG